jgi:protein-tyrosine phosphatase
MDWITDQIAIGDFTEARDHALLRWKGFASILGLVDFLQDCNPADLGVRHIEIVPLVDGPGNAFDDFHRAVLTLERFVTEAPPVLVHCLAGVGRSPTVVAGYLMRARGLTPEQAVAEVAARRDISIVPSMHALLVRLHRALAEAADGGPSASG